MELTKLIPRASALRKAVAETVINNFDELVKLSRNGHTRSIYSDSSIRIYFKKSKNSNKVVLTYKAVFYRFGSRVYALLGSIANIEVETFLSSRNLTLNNKYPKISEEECLMLIELINECIKKLPETHNWKEEAKKKIAEITKNKQVSRPRKCKEVGELFELVSEEPNCNVQKPEETIKQNSSDHIPSEEEIRLSKDLNLLHRIKLLGITASKRFDELTKIDDLSTF